jgi:hypothetical protein
VAGHREVDRDLEAAALAVVGAWTFDRYAARRNPAKAALQLRDVTVDLGPDVRGRHYR